MKSKSSSDLSKILQDRFLLVANTAAISALTMLVYSISHHEINLLKLPIWALLIVLTLSTLLVTLDYVVIKIHGIKLEDAKGKILSLLSAQNSNSMVKTISDLEQKAAADASIQILLQTNRQAIRDRLALVRYQERKNRDTAAVAEHTGRVDEFFASVSLDVRKGAENAYVNHPAVRTVAKVDAEIVAVEAAKVRIGEQWVVTSSKFSWWQKLSVSGPDFSAMDEHVKALQTLRDQVQRKVVNSGLRNHLDNGVDRANTRLNDLKRQVLRAIPTGHEEPFDDKAVSMASLFLSAASVPVSAWHDFARAGDVYYALKNVSDKYSAMSDYELWLNCLTMKGESLAGLASLAKGAYFENLVANETGGTLHEHFNHPETDIVIDGVAYQIKATDSVDYIKTVADGIPVIATSDVAGVDGVIALNYADEELERAVDLALGGMIIDAGDTAFDAIIAPLGLQLLEARTT